MGFLLIAAGISFGFILLTNQEMLYWQANQKRSGLGFSQLKPVLDATLAKASFLCF